MSLNNNLKVCFVKRQDYSVQYYRGKVGTPLPVLGFARPFSSIHAAHIHKPFRATARAITFPPHSLKYFRFSERALTRTHHTALYYL